ncbi:unnamed protein product [Lathyrus sativus]|nr:unnamed protein product [Lathyrus sativus]
MFQDCCQFHQAKDGDGWVEYKGSLVFDRPQKVEIRVLSFVRRVKYLTYWNGLYVRSVYSTKQLMVLFVALYVTALGTGGLKSSVPGFGSDQFDATDKQEKK